VKRELLALIICIFTYNPAFGLDMAPPALAYDPACLKITAEPEVSRSAFMKVEQYVTDLSFPYDLKYNLKENTWKLRLFPKRSPALVKGDLIEPTLMYDNTDRYRLYLINKGFVF